VESITLPHHTETSSIVTGEQWVHAC